MKLDLHRLMNDTKWEELRVAMYELEQSPKWRTCDVETGFVSDWDGGWFSHFRADGYKTIRWVELLIESDQQHKEVLSELARIHVRVHDRARLRRGLGHVRGRIEIHLKTDAAGRERPCTNSLNG